MDLSKYTNPEASEWLMKNRRYLNTVYCYGFAELKPLADCGEPYVSNDTIMDFYQKYEGYEGVEHDPTIHF
jgi:hypothetical protein